MDELARDAAQLRRLEQRAQILREAIRDRIRAERRSGTPQADVARRTGWTRETIRKIERLGDDAGDHTASS